MKKIMIMLGAAVMAACVHAASVDWKVNYSGTGNTWAGNGATVMAFNAADYEAIIDLVTVSGSENLATDLAAYSLGSSGFTSNRGAASTSAISVDNAPNSMFWMIFADGSTEAGSSVLWTAATDVTGNQYTPPATGSALTLNAGSFTNSGEIANVPEPTSGLLLLLGVAGLALRRKQK